MQKIHILALRGCVASSVLGLSELFHLVSRIALERGDAEIAIDPVIVGLTTDAVNSDEGIALPVMRELPSATPGDILIVPGCMTQSLDLATAVKSRSAEIKALQRWHAQGGTLAAQCSAIFLLAEAGLLAKKRATATWWAQEQLTALYPYVNVCEDETLTDDGDIICAAGPYSHLDLGLHLIEKLASRSLASLIAKFAMIERTPPSQSAFRTMDLMKKTPPLAKRVEKYVVRRLPEVPTVGEVASYLGMTTRTLQRHLGETVNMAPKALINEIRMGVAKQMIETSAARMPDLMLATGFGDESAFRKQFARSSGMTPKQYADRYGPAH